MDATEKIYRTIVRLARQRGFSFASQDRIGEYVHRSARTVRRHLRILEAEGAIRTERPNRNGENRCFVVGERVRSDVRSDVRSIAACDVRSIKETISQTKRPTTPEPQIAADDVLPLIEKIVERGVSVRVAAQLVAEHPAAAIETQILALEHRRPRDPAATLVSAIRGGWSPPVSLLDVIARQERKVASETAERAQKARDDVQAAEAERTRLEVLKRFSSMPSHERAFLEARAFAEVRDRTARLVATDSQIFKKMVDAKVIAMSCYAR